MKDQTIKMNLMKNKNKRSKKKDQEILEEIRDESEEEKIAKLLSRKPIFKILKKLSKGPVTLESLKDWFEKEFPDIALMNLIDDFLLKNVN